MMKDVIVLLIIALILGAAVFYIIKAKKKGVKCIGCEAGSCCCMKHGFDEDGPGKKEDQGNAPKEQGGCGFCG